MRVVNTVGIKNQANKILKWGLKSPTVNHTARGLRSKVKGDAPLPKGARQLLRQFAS